MQLFELQYGDLHSNWILVRMTLSIQTVKHGVHELVDDALKELESKNQLCTEINCICNQQTSICSLLLNNAV